MKSLNEISAESVADTDFVSVDPEQPLSKIKATMEEHGLREVPVVDGKRFKGMVSYTELMRNVHNDPTNIDAEAVMYQPAEADPEANMVELGRLRKDSGDKKFVITDGDRLKAVISEEDMVYPLGDGIEEFRKMNVGDLMSHDLVTLTESDKHDKAVKKMQEHNISRLPIVDSDGKLSGILSSKDAMRAMVPQQQMDRGDLKGHKDEMSDIPCRELMDPNPLTIGDPKTTITDGIRKMRSRGCREMIITDNDDRPQAILTLKDILDYAASLEAEEAVLVNLINVKEEGEKQQIHEKLETALKGKLGRVVETPRELNIHVKRYDEDGGNQKKYSLHARLFSELGITMTKKHGWSLPDTVDEVIDALREQCREAKEKKRDQVRERWKEGKYQQ
ncbi:MAG: CBS domain-containing protein [Candidatus Nanohaloarchaea archaeon]|nr:CBS domain-containing protein [Candidatus Nanohaloarchaea archaeon]